MVERNSYDYNTNPEMQAYLARSTASDAQASGDFEKFNLAGQYYEQAYRLFPEEEKFKKIAAVRSSIECYKRSASLKEVVRLGTDLLNNYAGYIPITERAELNDLVHLVKIRIGQED